MRRRKAGEKTSRSVRTRRILEAKPLPGNNLGKYDSANKSQSHQAPKIGHGGKSSHFFSNTKQSVYGRFNKDHQQPVKKDVEVVGDGASDKTSVDEERSSNVHGNS